jgi:hypothetical protein
MAGLAAAALVLFVVGPRWLAGARLADLADRSLPHWTATELRVWWWGWAAPSPPPG